MDRTVHFRSDGLALSPAEYARLLVRLAEERGIAADEFSREGVVVGARATDGGAARQGDGALSAERYARQSSGAASSRDARPPGARAARKPHLQRYRRLHAGAERSDPDPARSAARDLYPRRGRGRDRPPSGSPRVDPDRRYFDRIPGAPAAGRGLRLCRDAADRGLCAGAPDRPSPRWRPHLSRLGLYGNNAGELRRVCSTPSTSRSTNTSTPPPAPCSPGRES